MMMVGQSPSGFSAVRDEEEFTMLTKHYPIHDLKPGQYGVTDVYTRVFSYIDWIEKTMYRNGAKPWKILYIASEGQ